MNLRSLKRSQSADGVTVVLWSDGSMSAPFWAVLLAGSARSDWKEQQNLKAGWRVMEDLCLFDFAELKKVVKNARAFQLKLGSADSPNAQQWRNAMLKGL